MADIDIELVVDRLATVLKDGLNTKITAINTEKADSITLAQVDSEAWFFQTQNNVTVNLNPFVFYFLEELQNVESNGQRTSKQLLTTFWLVLEEEHDDLNIAKKMLRYTRAMEEVFLESFKKIGIPGKIEVQAYPPIQFGEGINSKQPGRLASVSVQTTLS